MNEDIMQEFDSVMAAEERLRKRAKLVWLQLDSVIYQLLANQAKLAELLAYLQLQIDAHPGTPGRWDEVIKELSTVSDEMTKLGKATQQQQSMRNGFGANLDTMPLDRIRHLILVRQGQNDQLAALDRQVTERLKSLEKRIDSGGDDDDIV